MSTDHFFEANKSLKLFKWLGPNCHQPEYTAVYDLAIAHKSIISGHSRNSVLCNYVLRGGWTRRLPKIPVLSSPFRFVTISFNSIQFSVVSSNFHATDFSNFRLISRALSTLHYTSYGSDTYTIPF